MTAIADVGWRIRIRREELEMGRTELAERAGLPPVAVRAIEDGQLRMRVDDVVRVSEALETTPGYILEGERNADPEADSGGNIWATVGMLAVAVAILLALTIPSFFATQTPTH
jgi:transcriptional regulator with XRE-family HTH domain